MSSSICSCIFINVFILFFSLEHYSLCWQNSKDILKCLSIAVAVRQSRGLLKLLNILDLYRVRWKLIQKVLYTQLLLFVRRFCKNLKFDMKCDFLTHIPYIFTFHIKLYSNSLLSIQQSNTEIRTVLSKL